ncbi:hypothetical protein C2S53_000924 [Perilla frutescens var. hirtella]|uniref:Pectinesterase n=1 Tax=Perilla frutescens var. hirtella TaxID=608512 RepID=A0AAD4JJ74_PERFH|nr:hypothetical protein C2S53_000924 [Perilla frutescens var. hirtella]
MGEWSSKKKAVIAGVASILLVAAVVAVTIGTTKSDEDGGIPDVESTTKVVDAICAPTQYKETCQNSLVGANTTDPKKLIETAINVTVKSIGGVLEKSSLLKKVADDPLTKGAFDVCKEVLEKAVDDLRRSVDKVGVFDPAKAKEYIGDLRTWLSAVVTNQETCVDAFENTTGDTGEKMKNLLKTARELSSNGLAMVTDISEAVGSLQLEYVDGSRKLLSEANEGFVDRRVLEATTLSLKPTIEVAKDGSGKFKSINEALATLPKNNNGSFIVMHIKAGVYKEHIDIPQGLNKLVFIGDGPKSTIITGDKSMAKGVQTYYTATLGVSGEDFMAKDIGVQNTAGPNGNQSLAVRVSGDRSVFYNVAMESYQDTLCTDTYRQFYRKCTISGTIDFVFGNGLALFQDCTFVVRKPGPGQECAVAAQGRSDANSNTAIIIQNGHFKADPALLATKPPVASYLGRPWKKLSRTIIMQSDIEGFINPAGWAPMIGTIGQDTCYYVEHNNRGPGANTTGRAKWKGIQHLTPDQVQSWTGRAVYGGDAWIAKSGVPECDY